MNRRNKKYKHHFKRISQIIKSNRAFTTVSDTWTHLPKLHQRALSILIPIVLILILLPVSSEPDNTLQSASNTKSENTRVIIPLVIDGEETTATKPKPKAEDQPKRVTVIGPQSDSETDENQDLDRPHKIVSNQAGPQPWHDYIVKKGDTLTQLFRNNNLSLADINKLVAIEGKDKPLSQINEGQLIRFKLTNSGDLDILQIEKDGKSVMFFRLSSGGFSKVK